MKTSFSFLILLLSFNGFGQNEPLLVKSIESRRSSLISEYIPKAIIEYKYNSEGNLIEKIESKIIDGGEPTPEKGKFIDYNSEGLLVKETFKRFNTDVDLWITTSLIEYVYDLENIRIKEKKIFNVGGDFQVFQRDYSIDTIAFRELGYQSDDMGNLTLLTMKDIVKLPDGRLDKILHRSINFPNEAFRRTIYEYDQYENLVRWADQYKADVNVADTFFWAPIESYNSHNEYDYEERLIRRRENRYNSTFNYESFNRISEYRYICNIVSVVDTEHFYEERRIAISRIEYFYEGENECFDIENEDLQIKVVPNPTTGLFSIRSNVFHTEKHQDAMIRIFNSSGQLILEEKNPLKIDFFEFNLSGLPNGIYYIYIQNQDFCVQEKIMLMN